MGKHSGVESGRSNDFFLAIAGALRYVPQHMSDNYINYLEVDEYGTHFVSTAASLVGASPLVNVQELLDLVQAKTNAVNTELEKAGIQRSALRQGSSNTQTASEDAKAEINRFWSYLQSLEPGVPVDVEAFFKGAKQGSLAGLKPADIKGKLIEVLAGFAADANKNLPDGAKWQTRLSAARDALSGLNAGTVRSASIAATAELRDAREDFLTAYNGVAKRVVLGLLILLGRKDEYAHFFKDLQVNEAGGMAKEDTAKEDEKKGEG